MARRPNEQAAYAFFNGGPTPDFEPLSAEKQAVLDEAMAQIDRAFGRFDRATGRRVFDAPVQSAAA